jgi:hypothetical protein
MATLAAVVLVAALGLTLVANPAARAAMGRLWHRLRDNPLRTYLYGPAPTGAADLGDTAEEPTTAVGEDDFDYSIYATCPPGTDRTP